MYQRGEIISVPFPFRDLSETKLRPALIISNEVVNVTGDVIITSKQKDESISIAIQNSDLSLPLPKNSFINCHKVVTVSNSLIQKKISQATPEFIDKVAEKIQGLISDFKFNDSVSFEE
jgi:mRNA interferase MazF